MTPETAMEQAVLTNEFYFDKAVDLIDGKFGIGFAKKNPIVVMKFIENCISEYKANSPLIDGFSDSDY